MSVVSAGPGTPFPPCPAPPPPPKKTKKRTVLWSPFLATIEALDGILEVPDIFGQTLDIPIQKLISVVIVHIRCRVMRLS